MILTDIQVAQLFLRQWRPGDISFESPSFTGSCLDNVLNIAYKPGTVIDPSALIMVPSLAPPNLTTLVPTIPTLSTIDQDYSTINTLSRFIPIATEEVFRQRLEICRNCQLWNEVSDPPRCDSVNCDCTKKLPWIAGETCPEKKWNK